MFLRTENVCTVPWWRRSSGSSTIPARHRVARAADAHAACPRTMTVPRGRAVGAEDQADQLRPPGADEAGDAEHVAARAAMKLASSTTPARRQALDPEQLLARRPPLGGRQRSAAAAAPCSPVMCSISSARVDLGGRRLEDHPAVAHDRDVVGDVEDLLQPVA